MRLFIEGKQKESFLRTFTGPQICTSSKSDETSLTVTIASFSEFSKLLIFFYNSFLNQSLTGNRKIGNYLVGVFTYIEKLGQIDKLNFCLFMFNEFSVKLKIGSIAQLWFLNNLGKTNNKRGSLVIYHYVSHQYGKSVTINYSRKVGSIKQKLEYS